MNEEKKKIELEKKRTYKNNDKIGEVIVFIGDKEVYKDDVYIKVKKEKKNIFKGLFND